MVVDQVARKIKELGGDNIVLISVYDLDYNMMSDLIEASTSLDPLRNYKRKSLYDGPCSPVLLE